MSKFKTMRFKVKDNAESHAIQEKLFSMGYEWNMSGVNLQDYGNRSIVTLESGGMCLSGLGEEYTLDRLKGENMTREEALIAMIQGKKVISDGKVLYCKNLQDKVPTFHFTCNGYDFKIYDSLDKKNEPFSIYEEKHTIQIDGKTIELSEESFKALKESLCSE